MKGRKHNMARRAPIRPPKSAVHREPDSDEDMGVPSDGDADNSPAMKRGGPVTWGEYDKAISQRVNTFNKDKEAGRAGGLLTTALMNHDVKSLQKKQAQATGINPRANHANGGRLDRIVGRGCGGEYASGGWIAGATQNKGALHRALGVPEGEKIPAKKLAKAEHSKNPTMRKRAQLAETLKGFHK